MNTIAILITISVLLIVGLFMFSDIPEGYEDADGFHLGRKEKK